MDNIMLQADPFHSFCVALVSAAPHSLEVWASQHGIGYSDFSDLCQKEETLKEIHGSLLKVCISSTVSYSKYKIIIQC